MKVEQRIVKVQAYASAMVDRYLSARQKLAIVEPFLADDMRKLFQNSYGAHAYVALSLTLVLDLIRDSCAFVLDTDERAPSLTNVWQLLQADDLRAALRSKIARPYAHGTIYGEGFDNEEQAAWEAKMVQEDVERKANDFDDAYARAAEGVLRIADSELATKFKTARDKAIAHYEMRAGKDGPKLYRLDQIGLTWDAPRRFIEQLDPVLWDVVLVATWSSYDDRGFDEMHRLYAADFWARLQGRHPVDRPTS